MRLIPCLEVLVAATWSLPFSVAQTYTQCNPLTSGNCPPDSALGKSANIDFTKGSSDSFTPQGNPTYDSNGVSLTVAQAGDSPQLTSKWYIMFGHVDFVIKAAPGTGIVSSAVLQSDDLDEIDWEWLGGDDNQVQSNYFGKGETLTYNRGAFHPAPENHDGFTTYSIDWTADQVVWSINGQTVRSLSSSTANQYPYPQTPMTVKVGAWCGGCPGNAPGTIQWAGGSASFAAGGSVMQVKSIDVTDYSTGSQYKYTGTDGTWKSITAVGGTVNPQGSKGSPAGPAAPSVSASENNSPMPFDGTHSDKSTAVSQPNAGGWSPTTMQTNAAPTVTTYPGLPAGWSVSSSGKVLPPSAAPVTRQASLPSSSPEQSPQDSAPGQYDVITEYDGRGFPVQVSQKAGGPPIVKHYDDQGFLITTGAAVEKRAISTSTATTTSSQTPSSSLSNSASNTSHSPSTSSTAQPSTNGVRPCFSISLSWSLAFVIFGSFLIL